MVVGIRGCDRATPVALAASDEPLEVEEALDLCAERLMCFSERK
jgi:hypothetical protein